ncbi:hypothetical protein SIID45300_01455 [Candidatus Magnetaquicoccaceae bacterium FCR-1]|uniref:Transposase n=1 Tax=Candidatus Magnetaquiglobus chichijimensis TaxID=3141448 RepID=A0ABQ0C8B4_9PROT
MMRTNCSGSVYRTHRVENPGSLLLGFDQGLELRLDRCERLLAVLQLLLNLAYLLLDQRQIGRVLARKHRILHRATVVIHLATPWVVFGC